MPLSRLRLAQSRDPPDILITTPETVQLLLFGDTLRSHLHTVRFVVLDGPARPNRLVGPSDDLLREAYHRVSHA